LIYDLAGNQKEAGKRLERAHKLDSTALRVVQAYGSWLSRNRSPKEALAVFEAFDKTLPRHPLVMESMDKLKAGEKLPALVTNAQAGAAEALYGLGASLGRRGGEDLGLVYLQLSLFLSPSHPLRCSRLPICTNPSRSRNWRSRFTSACRQARRCIATPPSSWQLISIASNVRTTRRSI
jgi:hypothetical protein